MPQDVTANPTTSRPARHLLLAYGMPNSHKIEKSCVKIS